MRRKFRDANETKCINSFCMQAVLAFNNEKELHKNEIHIFNSVVLIKTKMSTLHEMGHGYSSLVKYILPHFPCGKSFI